MRDREYFEIDEQSARLSHEMMSFRDYVPGSQTAGYKSEVDKAYDLAERVYEKRGDESGDRAWGLAVRYARKMADYYNRQARIGCMCPSVLIAGPANFPVKKKERQNRASDSNMEFYKQLQELPRKIENILYAKESIKSGDENAIALLEQKVKELEHTQERMKSVNTYFRKNKTLDDCPDLSLDQIEKLKAEMAVSWRTEPKPFESWCLSNNNQNIRSTKARLERLRKAKEKGTSESENEFFRVVENTEGMRLQIFFQDKPEAKVRQILKENGFRWAPSCEAWQRQLTNNARYALKRVCEKMKELAEEEKE